MVSCSDRSSAGHRQHNPPAPSFCSGAFLATGLRSAHAHLWEPFGGFPEKIPPLRRGSLFTFGDKALNWILIRSVFAGLIFKQSCCLIKMSGRTKPSVSQKLVCVTVTPSPLVTKLSTSPVKLDWQLCGSQARGASPALHLHVCRRRPQQDSSVCTLGKGCLQHLRVFTDGWTSVTELHRPTNGQNLWF